MTPSVCSTSRLSGFILGCISCRQCLSLVAVLTRFLQIRSSQQHQRQQKHSLSSYLHKQVCSLWWKTIQMKGEYYCLHSSTSNSLLYPDSGKQLYQGKDLNMCLQLIKRALNRGELSMCSRAFVCDLWRKTIAVIGIKTGNEEHLALKRDFFYLVTMFVKSGLFGSQWQDSR